MKGLLREVLIFLEPSGFGQSETYLDGQSQIFDRSCVDAVNDCTCFDESSSAGLTGIGHANAHENGFDDARMKEDSSAYDH